MASKKLVKNLIVAVFSIATIVAAVLAVARMAIAVLAHSCGPTFDPRYAGLIVLALVPLGIACYLGEEILPMVWKNLKKIWKSR